MTPDSRSGTRSLGIHGLPNGCANVTLPGKVTPGRCHEGYISNWSTKYERSGNHLCGSAYVAISGGVRSTKIGYELYMAQWPSASHA